MIKLSQKQQKGFTLIELLVVISIIGFLATASMVAFNSVRKRARDARRKSDLAIIMKALELNFDKNNAYTQPEQVCTDTSVGCGSCGCTITNYPNGSDWDASSDLRDLIANGFLKNLPKDPINNSSYHYLYEPWNAGQNGYTSSGKGYTLCAVLEIGGGYCLDIRS